MENRDDPVSKPNLKNIRRKSARKKNIYKQLTHKDLTNWVKEIPNTYTNTFTLPSLLIDNLENDKILLDYLLSDSNKSNLLNYEIKIYLAAKDKPLTQTLDEIQKSGLLLDKTEMIYIVSTQGFHALKRNQIIPLYDWEMLTEEMHAANLDGSKIKFQNKYILLKNAKLDNSVNIENFFRKLIYFNREVKINPINEINKKLLHCYNKHEEKDKLDLYKNLIITLYQIFNENKLLDKHAKTLIENFHAQLKLHISFLKKQNNKLNEIKKDLEKYKQNSSLSDAEKIKIKNLLEKGNALHNEITKYLKNLDLKVNCTQSNIYHTLIDLHNKKHIRVEIETPLKYSKKSPRNILDNIIPSASLPNLKKIPKIKTPKIPKSFSNPTIPSVPTSLHSPVKPNLFSGSHPDKKNILTHHSNNQTTKNPHANKRSLKSSLTTSESRRSRARQNDATKHTQLIKTQSVIERTPTKRIVTNSGITIVTTLPSKSILPKQHEQHAHSNLTTSAPLAFSPSSKKTETPIVLEDKKLNTSIYTRLKESVPPLKTKKLYTLNTRRNEPPPPPSPVIKPRSEKRHYNRDNSLFFGTRKPLPVIEENNSSKEELKKSKPDTNSEELKKSRPGVY